MKKWLILTSSSEKFSPRGGPPSGRLLKWRAVSDGPLRGVLTEPKIWFDDNKVILYHSRRRHISTVVISSRNKNSLDYYLNFWVGVPIYVYDHLSTSRYDKFFV